jgi:catechol 2,3-dioxygenase-like lactoylglutathione lyase family enzyme
MASESMRGAEPVRVEGVCLHHVVTPSPAVIPQEAVMSVTTVSSHSETHAPIAGKVDLKLEAVVIPVSDLDRAKKFYTGLGWRLDADFSRELVGSGVQVSEVFHFSEGPAPFGDKVRGPAPNHQSYGSYASFRDPDGNTWLLQEVTTRFPGRVDRSQLSFSSARDLASALRRAAAAHGEHEKRTGKADEDWPDWYARYMTAEESGEALPS